VRAISLIRAQTVHFYPDPSIQFFLPISLPSNRRLPYFEDVPHTESQCHDPTGKRNGLI